VTNLLIQSTGFFLFMQWEDIRLGENVLHKVVWPRRGRAVPSPGIDLEWDDKEMTSNSTGRGTLLEGIPKRKRVLTKYLLVLPTRHYQ
jgi:hypothetical protein